MAYVPACHAGNGSERGGGEYDAQSFAADGEAAVQLIRQWDADGPKSNLPADLSALDLNRLELAIKSTKDIHFTSNPADYDKELKDSQNVQRDIINIPSELRIIVWAPAAEKRKDDTPEREAIALHEFLNFYFRANLDGKGPLLSSDQESDDRAYAISEDFLVRLRSVMNEQAFRNEVALKLKTIEDTWESEFDLIFSDLRGAVAVIQESDDYDDCKNPGAQFHEKSCMNLMAMLVEALNEFRAGPSLQKLDDSDVDTIAKLAQLLGELEGDPVGPMSQLADGYLKFQKAYEDPGHPPQDPLQAAEADYANYVKTLTSERQAYANQKHSALEEAFVQITGQYLNSVETEMNQQFDSCPPQNPDGSRMICFVDTAGSIVNDPAMVSLLENTKNQLRNAYSQVLGIPAQ